MNFGSLINQVARYTNALRDILEELHGGYAQVEMVCVLGRKPSDWSNAARRQRFEESLDAFGARVVYYSQLIENAFQAYQAFLGKNEEAGRIVRLLKEIDEGLEL